jgi:2-amino-4-hydroxy-6-hydroxymethyldihydropteridine diphosphokinase
MPRVYVSVGSNIEREKHIREAVRALAARFGRLILSSVYESPALGFEGEDFYNLVVGFDTEASVEEVRAVLVEIERACGRTPESRGFRPRTLDLDLVLYGDLVMAADGLVLPRPEILEHAFVLAPLAEIAPEARHPVTGESFRALWERFDARGQRLRKTAFDPLAPHEK